MADQSPLPHLNLSSEDLLLIASFLTGCALKTPSQEIRNAHLDIGEALDSDSDASVSYSDIEEESEDDDAEIANINDGVESNEHMDRRQEERVMRRQRAAELHRQKLARASERSKIMKDIHAASKREACGAVAMAGVCRTWRGKLCLPKSCANTLLWKPLFQMSFPELDCQRVDNLEEKGFFNMFHLMMKASNAIQEESPQIKQVPKSAMTGVELQDAIFIMVFYYKGRYNNMSFSGIGMMDSSNQTIRVRVPKLEELCESKEGKWWKHAKSTANHARKRRYRDGEVSESDEDSDSDSEDSRNQLEWSEDAERRLSFPTADIFLALPSSRVGNVAPSSPTYSALYHIYHGKPKWKRRTCEGEDDIFTGPLGRCYDDDIFANLSVGKYLLFDGDDDVIIGSHACHGTYTDEQTESLRELDGSEFYDALPEELRKKDVMEIILGPL